MHACFCTPLPPNFGLSLKRKVGLDILQHLICNINNSMKMLKKNILKEKTLYTCIFKVHLLFLLNIKNWSVMCA